MSGGGSWVADLVANNRPLPGGCRHEAISPSSVVLRPLPGRPGRETACRSRTVFGHCETVTELRRLSSVGRRKPEPSPWWSASAVGRITDPRPGQILAPFSHDEPHSRSWDVSTTTGGRSCPRDSDSNRKPRGRRRSCSSPSPCSRSGPAWRWPLGNCQRPPCRIRCRGSNRASRFDLRSCPRRRLPR